MTFRTLFEAARRIASKNRLEQVAATMLFAAAPIVKDLTNQTWIKIKGVLFLLLGLLSASLLFFERPTLRVAALLALTVWSFCRFYYFAFYVLERYVDPTYRFSGLLSLARYLLRVPGQKP